MSTAAFQLQYRQEFVKGLEQRRSLLMGTVTTEAMIKGNQARFLVAGASGETAVTRGINGLIPATGDTETLTTVTLTEWHDLRRKTSFDIFASQSDQRRIMQMNSAAVINRKCDREVIEALDAASYAGTVSAAAATVGSIVGLKAVLHENGMPNDQNITALVTPAFEAELMAGGDAATRASFASRDYVNRLPITGADMAWRDEPVAFRWLNMMWIVHPDLTGVGTTTADCYFYHKSAVGHAINMGEIKSVVGYDEEQDYSYARTSVYTGAAVLQSAGVYKFIHNDNNIVPA